MVSWTTPFTTSGSAYGRGEQRRPSSRRWRSTDGPRMPGAPPGCRTRRLERPQPGPGSRPTPAPNVWRLVLSLSWSCMAPVILRAERLSSVRGTHSTTWRKGPPGPFCGAVSHFFRRLVQPTPTASRHAGMKRNNPPSCPECHSYLAVHRCPRSFACIDCGQPADVFVPDANALAIEKAEAADAAGHDPAEDSPLCDDCFYLRASAQEGRHHRLN
jgi:hypothetical protein